MTQEAIDKKLKEAVMTGTVEDVISALEAGADLFVKDIKGNSLLATAAYKRNFETFEFLLEVDKGGKKIDINEVNLAQQSLIMALIEGGTDLAFVKKLIESGADVNSYNRVTLPPLMYAIAHENEDLFDFLIDAGADVNVRVAESNSTPLLMLCTVSTTSSLDIMGKKLIEAGADINAQDNVGRTPIINLTLRSMNFMNNLEKKAVSSLKEYIMSHPNFNSTIIDGSGGNILFYLLERGFGPEERELLKKGGTLNIWQDIFDGNTLNTSGAHLLMKQILRVADKIAKQENAKSPNFQLPLGNMGNNQGQAPGQMNPTPPKGEISSIKELYEEVTSLLDRENFDVLKQNSIGDTVAGLAMLNKQEFVELWLDEGRPIDSKVFQVNRSTGNKEEILIFNYLMKDNREIEFLERLIGNGMQITYANEKDHVIKNEEPILNAVANLNSQMVSLLLKHGIDPNLQLKASKDGEYFYPLRTLVSGIVTGNYQKAMSDLIAQKKIKQGYEENEANGVENTIVSPENYAKICENIEKLEQVSEQIDLERMSILNELMSAGADINLLDKNKRTPIFYAKDEKTYEFMKTWGADIFAENENGHSYLQYLMLETRGSAILPLVFEDYLQMQNTLATRPFYEMAFSEEAVDSATVSDNIMANLVALLSEEDRVILQNNRLVASLKDNIEKNQKRWEVQSVDTGYGINEKLVESLRKDIDKLTEKLNTCDPVKALNVSGINDKDANGNTPLMVATAMGNSRFVKFFQELGADIDLSNNANETPLMQAIGTDNYQLVLFLVENGANVEQVNAEGKSVLDFAVELDNKDIIEVIARKLDPDLEEGAISHARVLRM